MRLFAHIEIFSRVKGRTARLAIDWTAADYRELGEPFR